MEKVCVCVCVYPLPPLLLTRREAGCVGGFNFNYRAVDTATIKSIAVFGCDIDHTGVGKITKLFPRLGCGIVPNSLLDSLLGTSLSRILNVTIYKFVIHEEVLSIINNFDEKEKEGKEYQLEFIT